MQRVWGQAALNSPPRNARTQRAFEAALLERPWYDAEAFTVEERRQHAQWTRAASSRVLNRQLSAVFSSRGSPLSSRGSPLSSPRSSRIDASAHVLATMEQLGLRLFGEVMRRRMREALRTLLAVAQRRTVRRALWHEQTVAYVCCARDHRSIARALVDWLTAIHGLKREAERRSAAAVWSSALVHQALVRRRSDARRRGWLRWQNYACELHASKQERDAAVSRRLRQACGLWAWRTRQRQWLAARLASPPLSSPQPTTPRPVAPLRARLGAQQSTLLSSPSSSLKAPPQLPPPPQLPALMSPLQPPPHPSPALLPSPRSASCDESLSRKSRPSSHRTPPPAVPPPPVPLPRLGRRPEHDLTGRDALPPPPPPLPVGHMPPPPPLPTLWKEGDASMAKDAAGSAAPLAAAPPAATPAAFRIMSRHASFTVPPVAVGPPATAPSAGVPSECEGGAGDPSGRGTDEAEARSVCAEGMGTGHVARRHVSRVGNANSVPAGREVIDDPVDAAVGAQRAPLSAAPRPPVTRTAASLRAEPDETDQIRIPTAPLPDETDQIRIPTAPLDAPWAEPAGAKQASCGAETDSISTSDGGSARGHGGAETDAGTTAAAAPAKLAAAAASAATTSLVATPHTGAVSVTAPIRVRRRALSSMVSPGVAIDFEGMAELPSAASPSSEPPSAASPSSEPPPAASPSSEPPSTPSIAATPASQTSSDVIRRHQRSSARLTPSIAATPAVSVASATRRSLLANAWHHVRNKSPPDFTSCDRHSARSHQPDFTSCDRHSARSHQPDLTSCDRHSARSHQPDLTSIRSQPARCVPPSPSSQVSSEVSVSSQVSVLRIHLRRWERYAATCHARARDVSQGSASTHLPHGSKLLVNSARLDSAGLVSNSSRLFAEGTAWAAEGARQQAQRSKLSLNSLLMPSSEADGWEASLAEFRDWRLAAVISHVRQEAQKADAVGRRADESRRAGIDESRHAGGRRADERLHFVKPPRQHQHDEIRQDQHGEICRPDDEIRQDQHGEICRPDATWAALRRWRRRLATRPALRLPPVGLVRRGATVRQWRLHAMAARASHDAARRRDWHCDCFRLVVAWRRLLVALEARRSPPLAPTARLASEWLRLRRAISARSTRRWLLRQLHQRAERMERMAARRAVEISLVRWIANGIAFARERFAAHAATLEAIRGGLHRWRRWRAVLGVSEACTDAAVSFVWRATCARGGAYLRAWHGTAARSRRVLGNAIRHAIRHATRHAIRAWHGTAAARTLLHSRARVHRWRRQMSQRRHALHAWHTKTLRGISLAVRQQSRPLMSEMTACRRRRAYDTWRRRALRGPSLVVLKQWRRLVQWRRQTSQRRLAWSLWRRASSISSARCNLAGSSRRAWSLWRRAAHDWRHGTRGALARTASETAQQRQRSRMLDALSRWHELTGCRRYEATSTRTWRLDAGWSAFRRWESSSSWRRSLAAAAAIARAYASVYASAASPAAWAAASAARQSFAPEAAQACVGAGAPFGVFGLGDGAAGAGALPTTSPWRLAWRALECKALATSSDTATPHQGAHEGAQQGGRGVSALERIANAHRANAQLAFGCWRRWAAAGHTLCLWRHAAAAQQLAFCYWRRWAAADHAKEHWRRCHANAHRASAQLAFSCWRRWVSVRARTEENGREWRQRQCASAWQAWRRQRGVDAAIRARRASHQARWSLCRAWGRWQLHVVMLALGLDMSKPLPPAPPPPHSAPLEPQKAPPPPRAAGTQDVYAAANAAFFLPPPPPPPPLPLPSSSTFVLHGPAPTTARELPKAPAASRSLSPQVTPTRTRNMRRDEAARAPMHASPALGFWAEWESRPRDTVRDLVLGQPPSPARPAMRSPSASAGELEGSQLSPRKLIKSLTAAGLTLEASVVEVRP